MSEWHDVSEDPAELGIYEVRCDACDESPVCGVHRGQWMGNYWAWYDTHFVGSANPVYCEGGKWRVMG